MTGHIGYIVGETAPQEFVFVTSRQLMPSRLEYLIIRDVTERLGDGACTVDVLAQVSEINVDSALLSDALTYEETESILRGEFAPPPRVFGTARVIGYLEAGAVRTPRSAPMPGHSVEIAPDATLRAFFSRSPASGLDIGSLLNRPGVGVTLDVNGLRRHLSVIAQTGAGKSYLVGRLMECLLERGATVLVLDPNSDYVHMRKRHAAATSPFSQVHATSFADQVDVYRLPGVRGRRLSDALIGGSTPFQVRFAELSDDDVCDLADIGANATRIREAVRDSIDQLRTDAIDYRPQDLIDHLTAAAASGTRPAGDAIAYIRPLASYPIWGYHSTDIDAMLEPCRLSVLDLAGLDRGLIGYVASRALNVIWQRARGEGLIYPLFVVLEEAHNLVPGDGSKARALRLLRTIAAEGRKFMVFLIVVTQRPSKVHQDILSQCGSSVIMKLTNPDDQRAVQTASEAISADLLANLPGLNTGEAIVIGPLTNVPAMIRVGERQSAEGGADVDLAEALERARRSRSAERAAQAAAPSGHELQKEPLL